MDNLERRYRCVLDVLLFENRSWVSVFVYIEHLIEWLVERKVFIRINSFKHCVQLRMKQRIHLDTIFNTFDNFIVINTTMTITGTKE